MAGNSIEINSNVNDINIQPDFNKITVVNPDNTSVTVTQPVTNVIQVAIPGPAGPAGPTGPSGSAGSGSFETGSFVTTSSFNAFTSSIQTEVDNLTAQTGSYVLNSQTGSFVTTSSFNNFTSSYNSGSFSGSFFGDGSGVEGVISSSYALTASYALNSTGGGDAFPYTGSAEITGSLILTGSYTSTGNITILGDLEADNFSTNGITRVGAESGDNNSGDLITVLGYQSGKNNTGRQIVSIGYQSATDNSADYVSVLGYRAGYLNTGIYLSSVGYSAGRENTGANQSSLGYTAGYINTGDNITVVGYQSGRENSGNNIVAIGHQAGYLNTLDNQFIVRHSTANSIPLIQGNFESGSIGIGLTLPQSNLHVAGDIWASGSNGHITASGNISASGDIITNALTSSGLIYPTVDGGNGNIIQTDGEGNLSFGRTRIYAQVKNISGGVLPKGIPVHVTSSVGNLDEVIASSASDASTMPATFVLAQQLNDGEEGLGILTGFINGVDTSGFNEGDIVYVAPNGGYTNQKPSGSNLIQNLGIVTKVDVNGSGFIYGSGRSNDVPNLLSGQIFFGSGSDQSHQIHISGALDQTIINNITASGNISSSGIVYGTTGSFSHLQGNSPITVGDPTIFQLGITGSNILLTSSIVDFDTEVSRSAQAAGFGTGGGGGGISAVVDDPSPQLGGNLDLNSQDITGTGNISIDTTSTVTPSLLLTSTNDTSDASPIIDLKRNSSSPSNGDYLGQIKFKGENDANQEVVYAKITGKISDVTDTTEDGLIEFATKQNGSNVINARLTSTDLKLINGTGLEVDGNISASGDISAITGSFDYIIGQVSTITWTVDFTDGELNTTLYAPYNLAINSVTNIYNSPTTAISSSGSPYTLGNAITTGEPIDITVSTGSVINLNITR